jgi:hypothetical protein
MQWRDDPPGDGGETCPVLLAVQLEDYLRAQQFAERGFLPEPGSWREQPAHWIDALQVMSSAVNAARSAAAAAQAQAREHSREF